MTLRISAHGDAGEVVQQNKEIRFKKLTLKGLSHEIFGPVYVMVMFSAGPLGGPDHCPTLRILVFFFFQDSSGGRLDMLGEGGKVTVLSCLPRPNSESGASLVMYDVN
jgi:hypothetical protein